MANNRQRLIFFFAAFIALLLPWLVQLILTPDGHVATGLLIGYEDYMTFLAKMKWGELGHWTYPDRYTTEPTEPVPIYFFYLFLGHLARATGLSVVWVFHLARSVLGALCLLCWWEFCKRHVKYPVVTFIVGIWASFGFTKPGTDLYYHELYVQGHAAYTGLLGFTHYTVDFMAILALFEAYLSRRYWLAVLGGAGLGMVHPFLLALYPAIILLHAVIFQRELAKEAFTVTVLAGLGAMPFTLPMFLAYQKVEWLKVWREQTYYQMPLWIALYRVSLSFGLAGIVAWARLPRVLKKPVDFLNEFVSCRTFEKLCAVWLVVAALMVIFAPLPNRREFGFFLSLPIGVLAAPWLVEFSKRVTTTKYNVILPLLVLVCTFYGLSFNATVFIPDKDAYHPIKVIEGLKWLEANSTENDGVICTWATGSFIPVYIEHPRPWVGHQSETLNFAEKEKKVKPFFEGKEDIPLRWAVITKKIDKEIPQLNQEPAFENEEIAIWNLEKGR